MGKLIAAAFLSLVLSSTVLWAEDSSRANQGIYGADINMLAFDEGNGVVFAAVQAAQSLFASDDSGQTWYQAFPTDSLLYAKGTDTVGFGGGGVAVTSEGGVTVVQTREDGGSLWGAQISDDGGATWKSVSDRAIVDSLASALESGGIIPSGRGLNLTFADVKNGIVFLGYGNILLMSTDAADSWSVISYPDSATAATVTL